MKIMIVDDEVVSRLKMQKILERLGEVLAVENGPAAIAAFKQAWDNGDPFQLIMLDISMPGMDGTEVLLEIKELESSLAVPSYACVRIVMVTCQSDKNSVVTCVQAGCDGYIVKPFDRQEVFQKLHRLGGDIAQCVGSTLPDSPWQAAVGDLIADFAEGNVMLPALPGLVHEIERLLRDPNTSAQELAAVIERDPIITARMIAVANSPLFRGTSPIRTVAKAIPRLGLRGTESVISAIASRNFYEQTVPALRKLSDRLWRHSLACAYAGRVLAGMVRYRDVERAFLMGMLHDVGKIILLNGLGSLVTENSDTDLEEILAIVHQRHNEFGGVVLESWGFPAEFAAMAREHDDQEHPPLTAQTTLIIDLANRLVRERGYSLSNASGENLAATAPAQLLKVGSEQLAEAAQRMEEQMRTDDCGLAAA